MTAIMDIATNRRGGIYSAQRENKWVTDVSILYAGFPSEKFLAVHNFRVAWSDL